MSAVERRIVKDPNITIGEHFRVLLRTDGKYVLCDERLPKDGSVAAIRDSLDAIVAEGNRLLALGSPIVIVNPVRVLAGGRVHEVPIHDDGDIDRSRRRA